MYKINMGVFHKKTAENVHFLQFKGFNEIMCFYKTGLLHPFAAP
jgi:hypothetical protein